MIDYQNSFDGIDTDILKNRYQVLKSRAMIRSGHLKAKMSKEEIEQKTAEWNEMLSLEKEIMKRYLKKLREE